MTQFKLELRAQTTLNDLYEGVDNALREAGIKKNDVSEAVPQTVAHVLHKMLSTDKYLCVMEIRQCAKISGIVIPKDRMEIYEPLHCMYWNEMTDPFRKTITAMILDDFRDILNPESEPVETIEIT